MRKLASLLCIAASLWCAPVRAADTDADSLDDSEEVGDFDGDGTDDWMDTDDDNDFVSTLNERQRAPQSGDSDGDGSVDWLDKDDDNDMLATNSELGPGGGGAPRDTDHDGKFDYLDDDDDDDGEPTATERQSAPPEPDVNHNNVPDYLDAAARGSEAGSVPTPNTCGAPSVNDAGLPVCWEQDHDGDGIWSNFEGAPSFKLDTDGDGTVDFLDADDDGDGLPTKDESPDPNHDGNPDDCRNTSGNNSDYLNDDDDDDQVPTVDERPGNKDRDTDLDGRPNHIDDDDDGDGISTRTENDGPEGIKSDLNKNGIPSYLDPDEKYVPPTVTGGAMGGDAGVAPVATLDAGSTPAAKDAGSARRDAGAGGATNEAGSGADADEGEDPFPELDPDVPAAGAGKSSGCAIAREQGDNEALGALACGLLALALIARRRRVR